MRALLSALLAGSLILGVGQVQAAGGKGKKAAKTLDQTFSKKDKNGDGRLTLQEFEGKKQNAKAAGRFKALDKNGDGALTLAEFKAGGKKKAKQAGTKAGGKKRAKTAK